MPTSRRFDLQLPDDFDVSAYDDASDFAVKVANPNDPSAPWKINVWFGFTSAWIGYGMRLRAAVEYSQEFASLLSHGTSPPREQQYAQERAFFGCITSTVSAVECFYLAAYCIGNTLDQAVFPLESAGRLKKYPRDVSGAYVKFDPKSPFSQQLALVAACPAYEVLSDLRNTLAHRGTLPRKIYLSTVYDVPAAIPSNPMALATEFIHDSPIEAEMTGRHIRWANQELSALTRGLSTYLRGRVLT
jgi:hypothetical protein